MHDDTEDVRLRSQLYEHRLDQWPLFEIDVLLRGLSGHDLDLRCLRRRRHILQVDGRYRYVAGHPHDLVRLSVDIYERRPQHLVPLGHILQGLC